MIEKHYSIGVDIGGSHITCAAVDLDERRIIRETLTERSVDNKGTADEIISRWSEALSETFEKLGLDNIKGIGFAMPGPFDYVNGICLIKGVPKYEKLYGINIGEAIAESLSLQPGMPVRFMNDASSFAVGEAWAGKAAASNRLMAITLGTGLGSAFVADRVPVVTGDVVPDLGCVYHISFRDGIADDYFSTRWFIGRYKDITGKESQGVREIAEAARYDGDIRNIFVEFGTSLGAFLSPYLIKFGAEVLVMGGNISRAYGLFGPSMEEKMKAEKCDTLTLLSELKEDAALLGSAYLLDNLFWSSVRGSLQYM
ncbi:MAG TPA: ROK family protein [Bacteroidetes bacterium]|nr:ROK family protein [Bacteroidota bacterium]